MLESYDSMIALQYNGHRPAIISNQNDCHISQGALRYWFGFMLILISHLKNDLRRFFERLNRHDSAIAPEVIAGTDCF